jgi:hypothetical protein
MKEFKSYYSYVLHFESRNKSSFLFWWQKMEVTASPDYFKDEALETFPELFFLFNSL